MTSDKNIISIIKECGIVGAGGGGFPTHVKVNAEVEYIVANGAECEPLLSTDRYIMETYPQQIVEGLRAVKSAVKAQKAVIALKKKYRKAIDSFNRIIGMSSDIELYLMDNYYPAGDEYEIVYNTTGRTIPEGGIPLDVNVVVINVNTLLNVFSAVTAAEPVTRRWVTVTGELKEPYIAEVPVGISVGELLKAGYPAIPEYTIIAGGPMMGKIVDETFRITKLCSGVIVLDNDNPAVIKHKQSIVSMKRRGRSVCDQCFDCSITCPRNLLGHSLHPHKIMRNLFIAPENDTVHITNAYLCCECGLCDMYACPLELSPRGLLREAKEKLAAAGIANPHNNSNLNVDAERDFRRVSQKRLMVRMGIDKYDIKNLPVKTIDAGNVQIPLKQHIGANSQPVVKKGQKVSRGELLAEIPSGKLGARIHSSISGTVTGVNDNYIGIKK